MRVTLVLPPVLLLAAAAASSPVPPPAVYWQSAPVLLNETLVVAGSGWENATARRVCGAESTAAPAAACRPDLESVDAWDAAVKVLLPADCGPPCVVELRASSGAAVNVTANRPEVWWATRARPSQPPLAPRTPQLARDVTIGESQLLRVFGRALAWKDSSSHLACVHAARPVPAPTTVLRLRGGAGATTSPPPISATSATCYEATFDTSRLPAGETYDAVVETAWGPSDPFQLSVSAVGHPPSTPPAVIDVDKDCGGDVARALARAANESGPTIVSLSPHVYNVTEPLVVPAGTELRGSRALASYSASPSTSTLAFVLPLPPPQPPSSREVLPAALTAAGSGVTLRGFALTVDRRTPTQAGHPPYVGIWLPPNRTRFVAAGVSVDLSYVNVSNAFRIEGEGFEITGCTLTQSGSCGGTSDHDRPFMSSVTLYVHNAREGLLQSNAIRWRCSAFDLDVSERIVFEGNRIDCLETGTVPHGNSLSAYDWHTTHWSRAWSVARNAFSRPPCDGPPGSGGQCGGAPGEDNWVQRETLTTDGSGGWAVGTLLPTTGDHGGLLGNEDEDEDKDDATATVHLHWTAWTTAPAAGCRLLVVAGPGAGQSRTVVSAPSNGTLVLAEALDERVVPGESFLAVVNDVADKLIVGNTFDWTEVVQAYALTLRYVAADNDISNANFRHTGGGATGGIMGAAGECYHGVGVSFFTEFVGNTFTNSDGLDLRDGGGNYFACGGYQGPWVRWSVVRRNALSGVSLASKNATAPGEIASCAGVSVHNGHPKQKSLDVVVEHTALSCPREYSAGTVDLGANCAHCVVR